MSRSALAVGEEAYGASAALLAASAGPRLPHARHLRVAFLSDAIRARNGVGTYYDDLVEHLRDHVGRVELLAPAVGEQGTWKFSMPGDPTQALHVPSVRRLWQRVQALSPHVIVSATPGVYGLVGMWSAQRLGTGFCVGYHTEYSALADLYTDGALGPITYTERALGGISRWAFRLWDRISFRCGTVLVHNASLVDAVRAAGAADVEVMGTPAPHDFLTAPLVPLEGPLRTVTFVGRLAPEKEVCQVLEAARRLPDMRFRIVGDGPLRGDVEHAAATLDNVDFRGWVARGRVRDLLDETDVVVLPSRYETFGTAAFEAMARGRLAVVSPECGITRWSDLREGLFPMRTDERLADALERLRRVPAPHRGALAERAREAATGWTHASVRQWVEVLLRVSRRPPADVGAAGRLSPAP